MALNTMKTKKEILARSIGIGLEFSITVISLIFIGYFLGSKISKDMGMLGTVVGAFLGLILATRELIKRFS